MEYCDIDRLIAERLMGLRICRCKGMEVHLTVRGICARCGEYVAPQYSTDPIASKELRKRLAEIYQLIQLGHYQLNQHFYFRCFDAVSCVWSADAVTEELAVCACALKSVGINLNEDNRDYRRE